MLLFAAKSDVPLGCPMFQGMSSIDLTAATNFVLDIKK